MSNQRQNQIQEENQFQKFNEKLIVKIPNLEEIKKELRFGAQLTQDHKLYQSSKWAGELLKGVTNKEQLEKNYIIKSFIQNNKDQEYQYSKVYYQPLDESFDDLLIARSLFDLREFRKCAFVLKSYQHDSKYQSAIFLYNYALFMAGEMKKEEELYENETNGRCAINTELSNIEKSLDKLYTQKCLNELNIYLYGLVLKEKQKKDQAKQCFIESLNMFPCFWSCWLELCNLIDNDDLEYIIININDHWMKNFYISNYFLDKQQNSNQYSIEININLCYFFKNSTLIQNMIAHAFYNEQEFDNSLEWFEKLVDKDPYRFENMDTYSNILYIKENQGELANLALRCFNTNKYTAETCCVIGNYYSLLGEHLKAILYFKKALKLDRNCQAAWTLMGHECLEMKNVVGAIDAYRNATENDSSDFRAWYGLGQTYELQNMNHYALYYFSQAVQARPKDPRMWNALGNCYHKLDKVVESSKCYERADQCKDKECIALHSLAKLYDLMGNNKKASECFEKNYIRKDEEQINDKEWAESILNVSLYHFSHQNYEQASELARRLIDFGGPERDQANSLLIEINKMVQNSRNTDSNQNFNSPHTNIYNSSHLSNQNIFFQSTNNNNRYSNNQNQQF